MWTETIYHSERKFYLSPLSVACLAGLTSVLNGKLGPTIGQLRACHIGRLVVVTGTVIRAGTVQVLEAVRHYKCSKCGHQ